jgi:predicted nuclease of predicted toxin-antitoxin system
MKDPEVLELAAASDRILVTHDVRTMPKHFGEFVTRHASPGVILIPAKMAIGTVIEELLMIWELSESGDWQNRIRRLPL